ncbi:SulP family inorganic anion transporter [Tropicimonas sp. TH_r6]|uniref:SulP family inorganic anion transporter n=1 Tax=Tropicimonas sp. TH_r6 TaxID=3082085 RepID=UPI00295344AB|nr:SulP family inorganic anion transporter [Tropicimonas sp. TH_r6]MDV7142821.1 SulP family inorganic anion transporter [Tropicimonas sp. TH_r6]
MPNKHQLIANFSPRRPWFSLVNRETVRADALAGLTNAAIVLPQGVAFAVIAGLPPEYGLYTAMITPVIAAIWGMSMIMVSGPTTAISAVMFATLAELAPPGTPVYIQFALTLTIMAGLFQLLAGVFRLGGLISFISHSVMVGFTAAAALLIGASQLGGALGISVESGGGVIERIARVVEHWEGFHPLALLLATCSLATIVITQKLSRQIPAYLMALVVGVAVGEIVGAREAGIEMFDKLPSLVPSFGAPTVALTDLPALLPGAVSVGFVGLLEAISIGRAFAMRRRERYDANQEIIGQGLSNVVAGFFQAYAGSGSFTRSAMNAESGARTPLSAVFAAAWLLALLFVVAPFVDHIPKPAMAGIIVYVAWRLISFGEIRHIVRSSRSETLILFLTFLAGITTELENAIFVGVIASLAVFLFRSSHPHIAVLAPIERHGHRQLRGALFHDLKQCPQVSILRLDGPLFFGSVDHVESEFRRFEALFPGPRFKILVLKGLGKIDLSGVGLLADEIAKARKAGGEYHLVVPFKETVDALERMNLFEDLERVNLHPNKSEAIQAATDQFDDETCRHCTIRAFIECGGKPAPPGVAPKKDAPKREGSW